MRANVLTLLCISASLLILTACAPSNDSIAESVQVSMQEKFNTDAIFRTMNLTVERVNVVNTSGNNYKGIATLRYKGGLHDVNVEVIADGQSVIWEVPAEEWLFVATEELDDLLKALQ